MQLRPAPADQREDGPGRVPHHGERGAGRLRRVPVQDLWPAAARAGRPAPRPRPVRRLAETTASRDHGQPDYGDRAAPHRPGHRLTSTPRSKILCSPRPPEEAPAFRPETYPCPVSGAKELRGARSACLQCFFDRVCDPVRMRTAYKCRAYPDETQQQVLLRTFGCVRLVWNRTLAAGHAVGIDLGVKDFAVT